ncbi:hypothetical protein RJ639_009471 [Escallonia herrerae]|uniref:Uncharacterized protein n=1 Tax=Escallonia herrerae TaxID=1293975 RepID=A0AA88VRU0_9ASTE|nr:hypothetical protein RJ639_009471 [Escallonia herrerae]
MEAKRPESKDESLKSKIAIRCAKAAILLSSLNRRHSSTINHEDKEVEAMLLQREVEDLKVRLVRERAKSKKIRLCSAMELLLQILLLLSLWTFCLMLAFNLL